MKLKDYLKTLDGETIISIGAKDGGSYMYIGKAGDVDLINDVFYKYHEIMVKRLIKLKNKELNLVMSKPVLGDDHDENENIIHEYADELAKVFNAINNINKFIRTYVDPLERNVVETKDDRICEEGSIVIITGMEIGRFWFKSEFDKQHG